jgi:hypothetical protein
MPDLVSTRPLLDKLGVQPGARVAILNLAEPWFADLLAERTHDVSAGTVEADTDLVFLGAGSVTELAVLEDLRGRIRSNGAIWVVSRKGPAATLRDVEVIGCAIRAGLVDNKVVAFSATHTSLRLVIPRRDRPASR